MNQAPESDESSRRNYSGPRKRRPKKRTTLKEDGELLEEDEASSSQAVFSGSSSTTTNPPRPPIPSQPKSSLEQKLLHRPSQGLLQDRNILKTTSLRAAQELLRMLQRDTLARSLRNRTDAQDLRASGILRESSLVKGSTAQGVLSHFLNTRPAVRDVLKGVLMLWTEVDVQQQPHPATPPPAPRHYHTLTLVGRRVVLLGGLQQSSDDLTPFSPYILDLDTSQWHAPSTPSQGALPPAARYAHSAVSYGRFIICFGGFGGRAWLNDTWILDVGGGSPLPPLGGGGGYTSLPPGFYSKGGEQEQEQEQEQDQDQGQKMQLSPPLQPLPPWERSPTPTSQLDMRWYLPTISSHPPPPRAAHTAVPLVGGRAMLLFGGSDGSRLYNDCYALLLSTPPLKWVPLVPAGTPPSPRSGHSALSLHGGSQVIFFGGGEGWGNESTFNDVSVLDCRPLAALISKGVPLEEAITTTAGGNGGGGGGKGGGIPKGGGGGGGDPPLLWVRPAHTGVPPTARYGHSASLVGSHMLIFGGWDARRPLNDLHVFDIDNFSWSRPSESGAVPAPRSGHASLALGGMLVVFGGCGAGSPYSDLFVCDTEFRDYGGGSSSTATSSSNPLPPPPPPTTTPIAASASRNSGTSTSLNSTKAGTLPPTSSSPAPAPAVVTAASLSGSGKGGEGVVGGSGGGGASRYSWSARAFGTGALVAALDAQRPSKRMVGMSPNSPPPTPGASKKVGRDGGGGVGGGGGVSASVAPSVGGGGGGNGSGGGGGGGGPGGRRNSRNISPKTLPGVVRPESPTLPTFSSSPSSSFSSPLLPSFSGEHHLPLVLPPARSSVRSAPPSVGNGGGGGGGGSSNTGVSSSASSAPSGGVSSSGGGGGGGGEGGDRSRALLDTSDLLDSGADALSVSSTPQLIDLLRAEVALRVSEDDDKYNELVAKLNEWRAERRTETAVILTALENLSSLL